MADLGTVLSLVTLIIIIVIGYFIYTWVQSLPSTDCPKYGTPHFIGTDGGPECEPGAVEFAGICYVDKWTDKGGVKTAVMTVEYPGDSALFTNCGGEIQGLNFGDDCSTLPDWTRGPGWFKTAACTCQHGGAITAEQYGERAANPYPELCPEGSDYFESACYTEACPSGTIRTEICTCST